MEGRGGCEVMTGDGCDLAEVAGVDSAHELHEGRCAAYLKADIDAHLSIDAFCDLKCLLCLCDVDTDWFFAVGVLACVHDGLEMLHVEEWWRRYLYGVDVFAVCQLLKCIVATKEKFGVDAGVAQIGGYFVEVIFALRQLVREYVCERDDAGAGVL